MIIARYLYSAAVYMKISTTFASNQVLCMTGLLSHQVLCMSGLLSHYFNCHQVLWSNTNNLLSVNKNLQLTAYQSADVGKQLVGLFSDIRIIQINWDNQIFVPLISNLVNFFEWLNIFYIEVPGDVCVCVSVYSKVSLNSCG